jgi:hypothetical protein
MSAAQRRMRSPTVDSSDRQPAVEMLLTTLAQSRTFLARQTHQGLVINRIFQVKQTRQVLVVFDLLPLAAQIGQISRLDQAAELAHLS